MGETSDASPEAPGALLDRRYRLVTPLARGGMSLVWRGYDELLGRPVAIKVLNAESNDATFAERVRHEAIAVARLSHPHIATVYDYGDGGSNGAGPYIVMELVEGESLAQVLKRGPMSWPAAVGVCAQVAAALASAHQYGVVHRDITPANIMLSTDGVKVIDFGVAAVTGDRADGVVFGTPAYLAPERISGGLAQPATDVYGLGMVLYQCLTGRLPWPGGTTKELLSAHRYMPPAPLPPIPGMPVKVAELCHACLCVDPSQRPGSGRAYVMLAEMARYGDKRASAQRNQQARTSLHALSAAATRSLRRMPPARPLAHEPIDVESSTVPIGSTRKRRRDRGLFILPALLMVVLIGGLGLSQIRTDGGGGAAPAPSRGPVNRSPAQNEPRLPELTAPKPKVGVAEAPAASRIRCRVSYRTMTWSHSGYAAMVTLANTSDTSIDNWRLQFNLPKGDRINGGWNGAWSQTGRKVTVEDVSYNSVLPPGSAISLGFLTRGGSRSEEARAGGEQPPRATGFTLNGHACESG